METLVLIDGNSLLNRAYYATPVFTTKDGLPTNGVFGFVKLMLKIIADKKPTHFAVAFDLRAPTFRHGMFTDYKAGRKPMPDDLAKQVPVLKEVLSAMQIKICQMEGYEADDLLGTLAKRFNLQTYIYTGDRDAYQLVDDTTSVCFTRKGVSDILELTANNFQAEIGFTPAQIIDLKSLMGDKSDNIPGVPGIGEKSAQSLIQTYGDLDGVYAHLSDITGALNKKLADGKESAYLSYKLATIQTDAPIDVTLGDCILKTPFSSKVYDKLVELEFKSLLGLQIFDKTQKESVPTAEKTQTVVTEQFPESVAQTVEFLRESGAKAFACDWTQKEFRFVACNNDNSAVEYVFPIKTGLLDAGVFENQLFPLCQEIFGENKHVIAYNAKELMHKLHALDCVPKCTFDDVSILKCLANGLGNSDSLQFCLEYYQLSPQHRAYGVLRLQREFLSNLNKDELRLYKQVELPLIRVLFDMERQGVCVDEATLAELSNRYNQEKTALTQRIYMLAGEVFNVNSTQQLGKVLFENLKIGQGVKKNKDSKSYKTTAEELEKYADDYEIVQLVLRYRTVQKLHSTYIEGFKPIITNGRVHTTYHQSNTATGRLSSTNPNLQNIPIRTDEGKELRKLFTASAGHVLIDADYSQIELRLLAHFSGCKELIQAYCEGQDIHASTASQVFEVPIEQVTAAMRREAKAVNFGIIYGISAFGLSTDLNISAKKAQSYINRYFETYSDVQKYIQGNVQTAQEKGFVTTLLGRRRVINEIKASNHNVRAFGERAAMNMPLQGSSADIIKIAMINVANKLKEKGFKARLVLQVHDELVIDCPESEQEEVAKILKAEMENAVSLRVPLTVDVHVGKNWFDAK